MKKMKEFIKAFFYILLSTCLVASVHADVLVTYYHNDLLGSPVAATDENGNVLWQEEYQPYGERIESETASQLNRQWYTGKQLDQDTSLTYLGARYYDQHIGRFMGTDPIGFVDDNPHTFNRYTYASNNPYKYVDPTGEAAETVFDVVSFGVSVGLFTADPSIGNAIGVIVDGAAVLIPFVPGGVGVIRSAGKGVDATSDAASVVNRIPDDAVVVRGGVSDVPGPGEVFSGAAGRNLEDAAQGVPHGKVRATTAGDIRAGGGTVDHAPELTRSGALNEKHVNICKGSGPCSFGDLQPNPVPKADRVK